MFDTASLHTAPRRHHIRSDTAGTQDIAGHDDGIHRQVALVEAADHQRWVIISVVRLLCYVYAVCF